MQGRDRQIVTLIVLLALLVGCNGGGGMGTETEAVPTPGDRVPDATASPAAQPTPEGLQAIVVDVINDVEADPRAEGNWQGAVLDMAIYVHGQVWAHEASTARVAVEEGLVRVAPNTIFAFDRLGADTLRLGLEEGQMWINVEGLEEGEVFEVETPAAVTSVRGTRFGARVGADGTTVLSTQVGTVTVSADGAVVDVGAGHQTAVVPGEPPGAPEPMLPEEQVRWGMAVGPDLDVVMPVVGVTGVFTSAGNVFYPQLSPGGDYVAFVYYVDGYFSGPVLYDVRAGGFRTQVLPPDADGISFSPTGDRLAYRRWETNQICTAGVDGSDPACFGGEAHYGWPFWSPDGEWLLFSSDRDGAVGGFNLFRAHPDGSGLSQLTFSEGGYNEGPAWSPDGSRIAFTFYVDHEQPAEVWVMGTDGSDARLVFTGAVGGAPPAWGPDGSSLAVPGYMDGETGEGGGLWLVPLDGLDPSMVPGTDGWWCYDPVWSPTFDGWPLFFGMYGLEAGYSGVHWYAPDGGRGPVYFSDAYLGPVWGAGQVAFGYERGAEGAPWTEVYVFRAEHDFWP